MEEARAEEMATVKRMQVWIKVDRDRCIRETGRPPIKLRWVDTNKGDDEAPNYRSRLVARDIKRKGEDSIFAPTPPLEALRAILSLTATREFWPKECWEGASAEGPQRVQISFIDISRAYFNARTTDSDPVYVDLPEEDKEDGMCGILVKSMYGTRDADHNWEHEYREFMEGERFVVGQASPCVFKHPKRKIRAVIHGDDFTLLGSSWDLDWF